MAIAGGVQRGAGSAVGKRGGNPLSTPVFFSFSRFYIFENANPERA